MVKSSNIILREIPDFIKVERSTTSALTYGTAAISSSGTVTLEAALLGTPMIICNRASWVTYMAFKMLSRVPYLGLPNIISKREICPEMLQSDTQPHRLANLIRNYLLQPNKLGDQKKALNEVVQTLGEPGVLKRVSNHIAEEFLQ